MQALFQLDLETKGEETIAAIFLGDTSRIKEKLLAEGADHADVPEVLGFERYLFRIQQFIEN